MATNPFGLNFEWDDRVAQYRWIVGPNKGQLVSRDQVRIGLDKYLEKRTNAAEEVSERLRRREISLAQWTREMEGIISRGHLSGVALANGGWHNLSQADYGRAGGFTAFELRALRQLEAQMEAGMPLDGRWMNRVKQYGQAPRHTYHAAETPLMEERGYDEEISIRHAQDSCEECLFWAKPLNGKPHWVQVGTSPQPGGRICRRNCKCTKRYRRSKIMIALIKQYPERNLAELVKLRWSS